MLVVATLTLAADALAPGLPPGCVANKECRRQLLRQRGRLLQEDSAAAAREFDRDLLQVDADDAAPASEQASLLGQGMLRNLVTRHGWGRELMREHARVLEALPANWTEAEDVATEARRPESPPDGARRCQQQAAGTEQRTYGLLDIADGGSLVLMQGLPPFETRRDLTLNGSVECPALRARIRSLFFSGRDIDLLVSAHLAADRRQRDCVMAITQEVEDVK